MSTRSKSSNVTISFTAATIPVSGGQPEGDPSSLRLEAATEAFEDPARHVEADRSLARRRRTDEREDLALERDLEAAGLVGGLGEGRRGRHERPREPPSRDRDIRLGDVAAAELERSPLGQLPGRRRDGCAQGPAAILGLVQTPEVFEAVQHRREGGGLPADHVEEPSPLLLREIAFQERGGVPMHQGERRLELMDDPGGELALDLREKLVPLGHMPIVEGPIDQGSLAVKLLVLDDHAIIRDGIRLLAEQTEGIDLVAEAGTVADALTHVERERPDVALVDLDLPAGSGLNFIREAGKRFPGVRCLVLTVDRSEETVLEAMNAGASGFVTKESSLPSILDAARRVAAGETVVEGLSVGRLVERFAGFAEETGRSAEILSRLSDREREVLALLASGLTNQQIGSRLGITARTASTHVANIYRKIEVTNRVDAARAAMRLGLTPGPAEG